MLSFYSHLEQYLNSEQAISIYEQENVSTYWCGFLCMLSESEYVIKHISAAGEYDGYCYGLTENIKRVEVGQYEESIQTLYHYKKESHESIPHATHDLLLEILRFAKERNFLICTNFYEEELHGFVKEIDIDNELLILQGIGLDGYPDETMAFGLDAIDYVWCDRKKLAARALLYKMRNEASS